MNLFETDFLHVIVWALEDQQGTKAMRFRIVQDRKFILKFLKNLKFSLVIRVEVFYILRRLMRFEDIHPFQISGKIRLFDESSHYWPLVYSRFRSFSLKSFQTSPCFALEQITLEVYVFSLNNFKRIFSLLIQS